MRLSRLVPCFLLCAAPTAGLQAQATRLDSLDTYVREQMARRRISGASLAIIQDGRIVAARAYGVVDETTRAPVTTATLFQAGSISKPVSALGALHLLTYLGVEDVTGRGVRRHGSNVARVRYYRVTTTAGQRYLFVHLTEEGIVTDFDVVER